MEHHSRLSLLAFLLALTTFLPGCVYERARINEKLLNTEGLSSLAVGETTIEQALDIMGPPALTNEAELFDKFVMYPRHLRYVIADRRTDKLLVLPSWIIGINQSEDTQSDRELLLLFDEEGVLTHGWLGGSRSMFPLTQGRDGREVDTIQSVNGGAR